MRYESRIQSALRIVVRDVLELTTRQGLKADHHFYISFATNFPGIEMPEHLKEQYPEEITIVLQHEFWDLEVWDDRFSVTLCFDGEHERLVVPFSSLLGFADPSVKFGLHFTPELQEAVSAVPHPSSDNNVVSLDSFRKKR